jgi:hypothetical protein
MNGSGARVRYLDSLRAIGACGRRLAATPECRPPHPDARLAPRLGVVGSFISESLPGPPCSGGLRSIPRHCGWFRARRSGRRERLLFDMRTAVGRLLAAFPAQQLPG